MTRVALLVGRWAIKIPSLRHGGRMAVLGALANLNERRISIEATGDRRLARTYWCAPLGLLSVQERVGPSMRSIPWEDELASVPIKDFCGSAAAQWHNCSRREDGSLVCFDYGAPSIMYAENER